MLPEAVAPSRRNGRRTIWRDGSPQGGSCRCCCDCQCGNGWTRLRAQPCMPTGSHCCCVQGGQRAATITAVEVPGGASEPAHQLSADSVPCRSSPAAASRTTPMPWALPDVCCPPCRSCQCNSTASFDRVFSKWRSFQPSCRAQVEGGRSRGWSVPGVHAQLRPPACSRLQRIPGPASRPQVRRLATCRLPCDAACRTQGHCRVWARRLPTSRIEAAAVSGRSRQRAAGWGASAAAVAAVCCGRADL